MAFGTSGFNYAASAVSDLYSASSARLKAKGDLEEAKNYDLAAGYADMNVRYTETSTAIKEAQADRALYTAIGGERADVASAGFAESGSALDLLRSSASQGSLQRQVLGQQGLITEEGYKQQAASYRTMSQAAHFAAEADENTARGLEITAGIKGVASVASFVI